MMGARHDTGQDPHPAAPPAANVDTTARRRMGWNVDLDSPCITCARRVNDRRSISKSCESSTVASMEGHEPLAVGTTVGLVELSANPRTGVVVMNLVSGENRWSLEFSRAVSEHTKLK